MNIKDEFKDLLSPDESVNDGKKKETIIREQMNYLLCKLLDRSYNVDQTCVNATYSFIATQSVDACNKWKVDTVWQNNPRTLLEPKHKSWIIRFDPSSIDKKQWTQILKPLGGIKINSTDIVFMRQINKAFLGFNLRAVIIIICKKTLQTDIIDQDNFMMTMELMIATTIMKMADLKLHQYHNAFVSNLAHKVRTPLNGILNISPLLAETQLSQIQQEYMSTLTKSGISLASVMSDTVDISRLAFNQITLNKEVFAIRECIEESLQFISSDAKNKKIQVETNIEASVPTYIYCDYRRLRQILIILLRNSISFINKNDGGAVNLRVSGAILDEDNELLKAEKRRTPTNATIPQVGKQQDILYYSIEFSVGDNGIGMTDEQQASILDSFWLHIDNVTLIDKDNYESSGLGLAIAQKLCHIMGGDLWLGQCELDKGSQIVFNIIASEDQYPSYVNTSSLKTIRSKHALIVDSDSTSRIRFHNTLSKWGMKCTLIPSQDELITIHLQSGEPIHIMFISESLASSQRASNKSLIQIIREAGHEFPIVVIQQTGIRQRQYGQYEPNIILSMPIYDKDLMEATINLVNKKVHPTIESKDEIDILIAEDDAINKIVFEKLLPRLGYHKLTITSNGREAYNEIIKNPYKYKIMLIDIRMPIMDGITLSNYIYEFYNKPDKVAFMPYMIGVSAQSMLDSSSMGKLNAFIPKPIDVTRFDEVIRVGLTRPINPSS